MKQNIVKKTLGLSLVCASFLHATNGDNLIAVGSKIRAMGGAGIAVAHGTESGLINPALITSVGGIQYSFGGIYFVPDIETTLNGDIPAQPHKSDTDNDLIPQFSIAYKIDDNWFIGAGLWGTAGMGVNYSGAGDVGQAFDTQQFANFNMETNLQLLQFAVPLAYKIAGLSVSISPIIQYGNLDINFAQPTGQPSPDDTIVTDPDVEEDFGFGYTLGIAYDLSHQGYDGFTVGAVYKSAIEMTYNGQFSTVTEPFGIELPDGDTLEQPVEFGVGFAYNTGEHTFAFDYKKIQWSDAKGYQSFLWEDQNVYAFGYEYAKDTWALRAGYNFASSAVVEASGGNLEASIAALNFFNLLGFPATAEAHYTVGGSYQMSEGVSIDLAYVYSPQRENTYASAGLSDLGLPFNSLTNKHSENSLSFQLNFTH